MFPFLFFFFYVSYENSRNEDSPNTPLLYLVKLDGRRKYDRFFERGVCLYTYCLVTESSVSSFFYGGGWGENVVFFRGDDFTISSSLLGEWRYSFDIESMYISVQIGIRCCSLINTNIIINVIVYKYSL